MTRICRECDLNAKLVWGQIFVRLNLVWLMSCNFKVKMDENSLKNNLALALLAMRPRQYQRFCLFR